MRRLKNLISAACAILLAGCLNIPTPIACEYTQSQVETIRSNARAYLQNRLGDGYVLHGSKWAVTSRVVENQDTCGLRIVPMGVSTDPDDFLRGEGFVYFDTETLEPTSVAYFLR